MDARRHILTRTIGRVRMSCFGVFCSFFFAGLMQFRVSVFAICLISITLVQCSRVLARFGRRVVPNGGPGLPTEPLPTKVCMLLGFKSKSGLYLRDAVFGDNNVPKDTVVFQLNTVNELVSASELGDVAIVHVSALERNTDAAPLLESISVYVQGLCKRKRASSSLIVLVDGREDEGRVLEKIVDEIAAEVLAFDCSLEVHCNEQQQRTLLLRNFSSVVNLFMLHFR